MASKARVLLLGAVGDGFKSGIRSSHAVHAPETLPVLCMGRSRSPAEHVFRYRTSAPTADEWGQTEAARCARSRVAPPRIGASTDWLR